MRNGHTRSSPGRRSCASRAPATSRTSSSPTASRASSRVSSTVEPSKITRDDNVRAAPPRREWVETTQTGDDHGGHRTRGRLLGLRAGASGLARAFRLPADRRSPQRPGPAPVLAREGLCQVGPHQHGRVTGRLRPQAHGQRAHHVVAPGLAPPGTHGQRADPRPGPGGDARDPARQRAVGARPLPRAATARRRGAALLRGPHRGPDRRDPRCLGRHRQEPHEPGAQLLAPQHEGGHAVTTTDRDDEMELQALLRQRAAGVEVSGDFAPVAVARRRRDQRTRVVVAAAAAAIVAVGVPVLWSTSRGSTPPVPALPTATTSLPSFIGSAPITAPTTPSTTAPTDLPSTAAPTAPSASVATRAAAYALDDTIRFGTTVLRLEMGTVVESLAVLANGGFVLQSHLSTGSSQSEMEILSPAGRTVRTLGASGMYAVSPDGTRVLAKDGTGHTVVVYAPD